MRRFLLSKRKAGLPNSDFSPPGKLRRWLRRLAIFAGLFALMVIYVQIALRHDCVVMPNGLLIGRATVFSTLVGWGPDLAIKYPDGRLLRRGDGSINFYDHESVGGDFPGEVRYKDYDGYRGNQFIYIKDVGLLIESENPDQFQFYWDKKTKELSDVSPSRVDVMVGEISTSRWADGFKGFGGNLYLIYKLLKKDPKNRRSWCRTAWLEP